VLAGYAYLGARIVAASLIEGTEGKVPANTPRHSASLWTTYNLTGEWELGGGATYMSERFANNTNVVSVGDYVRADATLAYHRRTYDVRLNLLNLTDKLNFDALIPSDGGRSVPGTRRAALLTYTMKF
jgi:catecholate siderophore receptor